MKRLVSTLLTLLTMGALLGACGKIAVEDRAPAVMPYADGEAPRLGAPAKTLAPKTAPGAPAPDRIPPAKD